MCEAEEDLAGLIDYISDHDSIERADDVLDRLPAACERLDQCPERGLVLPELRSSGIKSYREDLFKHYRVICEVIGREAIRINPALSARQRGIRWVSERRLPAAFLITRFA